MTLYFCKSSLQDESSTSTANFHCLLIDLDSSCFRKEGRLGNHQLEDGWMEWWVSECGQVGEESQDWPRYGLGVMFLIQVDLDKLSMTTPVVFSEQI